MITGGEARQGARCPGLRCGGSAVGRLASGRREAIGGGLDAAELGMSPESPSGNGYSIPVGRALAGAPQPFARPQHWVTWAFLPLWRMEGGAHGDGLGLRDHALAQTRAPGWSGGCSESAADTGAEVPSNEIGRVQECSSLAAQICG